MSKRIADTGVELEWIEPSVEDSVFDYHILVVESGEFCLRKHKEYETWEEKYTDGKWYPVQKAVSESIPILPSDPVDWGNYGNKIQSLIEKFEKINAERENLLSKLIEQGETSLTSPFLFGLLEGKIEALDSVIRDLKELE